MYTPPLPPSAVKCKHEVLNVRYIMFQGENEAWTQGKSPHQIREKVVQATQLTKHNKKAVP